MKQYNDYFVMPLLRGNGNYDPRKERAGNNNGNDKGGNSWLKGDLRKEKEHRYRRAIKSACDELKLNPNSCKAEKLLTDGPKGFDYELT